MKALDEIAQDSDILEIIEQSFKTRGLEFQTRQLVCDDRLRAAFVLPKTKTIIDIVDKQFEHYELAGVQRMKHRGRLAAEIAGRHGFAYRLLSLVEMDFAVDEQRFLDNALYGATKP